MKLKLLVILILLSACASKPRNAGENLRKVDEAIQAINEAVGMLGEQDQELDEIAQQAEDRVDVISGVDDCWVGLQKAEEILEDGE